jgi:hypothetical protein
MKAAAIRFARLFVPERDSLGVVSFGATVQQLPLRQDFLGSVPEYLSGIKCFGATNTSEAVEAARAELARGNDPEAVDAIILLTDGLPNVITSDWPVDARQSCPEASGGFISAHTVIMTGGVSLLPMPADASPDEERVLARGPAGASCFFGIHRFPYIPEKDRHGYSVSGGNSLRRFEDGPNAGRIRGDVAANFLRAASNQIDNVMRAVRAEGTLVYVIGYSTDAPDFEALRMWANDREGTSFHPDQPDGKAILIQSPETFWPAFQRIREEIVRHATVH